MAMVSPLWEHLQGFEFPEQNFTFRQNLIADLIGEAELAKIKMRSSHHGAAILDGRKAISFGHNGIMESKGKDPSLHAELSAFYRSKLYCHSKVLRREQQG